VLLQVLRTDYHGRGKYAGMARALNKIGRAINSLSGENGIDVYDVGGSEIRIANRRGHAGTFPWHKVVNGYKLSGTEVTIVNCCFQIGANPWKTLADQTRDITGADGDWWIAAQYTYATQGFAIGSPTTVMPVSSSDGTVFRQPLYSFTKAGTNVSRNLIAHMGVVQIPAVFGD
jgi:hypothetical protein